MTPTLMGRVQTRTVLLTALGVPITLPFCVLAFPLVPIPLVMLAIVWLVGLTLDPVYHALQQRRWDHDWPVHLQIVAGLVELLVSLPFVVGCGLVSNPLTILLFPFNYLFVWLAMFLVAQGPMRVVFLRWRFRGGELTDPGGDS